MIDENSKMEMLDISYVDLFSLDPALVTRVQEKLQCFTNSLCKENLLIVQNRKKILELRKYIDIKNKIIDEFA